MKELSLVIPVSGESEDSFRYLLCILQSLKGLDQFFNYEILICINPTNGNLQNRLILQKNNFANVFTRSRFIQIENKGVNFARQKGLELAQFQFVLFLDDDCEVLSPLDIVKLYEKILAKEDHLLAVGGRYQICKSTATKAGAAYYLNQMDWLDASLILTDDLNDRALEPEATKKSGYCQYLLGGFFILNKSLTQENKLFFDEKIIFGGTEKEFFIRAGLLGLKMFLLPVRIQHQYRHGLWSYMKKSYKQGRGQAYIEKKLQMSTENEKKAYFYKLETALETTIFQKIYNLCFWWGYHKYNKDYKRAFILAVTYPFRLLNIKRHHVIQRLQKNADSK